jgi:L-alanine-DL-glutamate epimerase-like enolase superfamily enzyme
MHTVSRRGFLSGLGASIAGAPYISAPRSTDIRIEEVTSNYEEFRYRSPYKFGGVPVDRVTILNVSCRVRTRNGIESRGFGSMPLGNVWSFPSREMSYDTTLTAMKRLSERIITLANGCREFGHPLDLHTVLEAQFLNAAREVSKELSLSSPIPVLCTLVTASALDAAIHDGFGRVQRRSCYNTYGSDLLSRDLSAFLNSDFKKEWPDRYVKSAPTPRIAMFHSVGGSDAVLESELKERLKDGLPETLAEWIRFNGLTHIKIKLQGEDLEWDINRVVAIDRIASETSPRVNWQYCVDFNERCPNVEYVLTFLRRVKELTPRGYERILYLEQPTARDLKSNPANSMHQAAKLRPVVVDESLTDLESLLLARDLGYTGVALKACKGQSHAILMAAASQKYKMFLTVQDLTCPGASLIHSVGIAAHVPGVAGLEANARQYIPEANAPWRARYPGIFDVKDGTLRTAELTGPGLGVEGRRSSGTTS